MQAAQAKRSRELRVWGSSSFENAAAVSWLEELEYADGLDYVEETLDEVLDLDASGDVPDPDTSARAIAAAETVAALVEKPRERLPEEVRQWCFDHSGHDLSEVHPKALQALGVIISDSDLRDVIERAGDSEVWESELEELRDRLRL